MSVVQPTRRDLNPRLEVLVAEAKQNSPFSGKLYSEMVTDGQIALTELPLVDHSKYSASYHDSERSVMTSCQIDGILMKTGGTTGIPKFTSLRAGDRVANLFFAGDLYGSFLLRILSIISLPIPAIQIPIGGLMAPDMTAHLLRTCRATAVLLTITSLVRLAAYCRPRQERFLAVIAVMFDGEPIFDDQVAAVAYLFPNATIRSCIYGSIDAGVIAVSAGSPDPAEHIGLSAAMIVEILVDQDGNLVPTEEITVPGTLVVTNLIRDLSPVIRYPTGDKAERVDKLAGIFRLLGHSNYAVRVGPVSLDISHLRQLARSILKTVAIEAFQVVITREEAKDAIEIAFNTSEAPLAGARDALVELLSQQRPMFKQHVELGLPLPRLFSDPFAI